MPELHKPKVAILASGAGTTAEAFILAMVASKVDAEISVVISNNKDAGVFGRVQFLNKVHKLGIGTLYLSHREYPNRKGEEVSKGQTLWESEEICKALDELSIAHVALMGYMKIVRGDLLQEYGYLPEYGDEIFKARMSNTHPGPLPLTANTHGIHASEKVLEEYRKGNRKNSAHTVHLVSAGIDQGPVIARHQVPIEPDDVPETLFRRVQSTEKKMLPTDIDRFLELQAGYLRTL